MHRLIVLNGSLKQVKTEPFDYEEGKSLARYLEEGWAVAQQLTWGDNLVLLLEKEPPGRATTGSRGPASPRASEAPCRPAGAGRALLDRDVGRLGRPGVDLPRPGDPAAGLVVLLLPVGDPARHPPDGEDHREHARRDAHRPHQDAAVEVDVRVQLPLDEVRVLEAQLLQLGGRRPAAGPRTPSSPSTWSAGRLRITARGSKFL